MHEIQDLSATAATALIRRGELSAREALAAHLAAFCNVFGFRPSLGVIPVESPATMYNWLSRSGPMARTVEDLSLFTRASAGPTAAPNPRPIAPGDFRTPQSDLRGVRISYSFRVRRVPQPRHAGAAVRRELALAAGDRRGTGRDLPRLGGRLRAGRRVRADRLPIHGARQD